MSTSSLGHSASSPDVLDKLRPTTAHFMMHEYRESYPFRNHFEARHGLQRKKAPTTEFIKFFSQAPLAEDRLYDLKVSHGVSMRARSAKAAEKQAAAKEATVTRSTTRKMRELTSAEQMRQLCDALRTSIQVTEKRNDQDVPATRPRTSPPSVDLRR
eukprot:TRINITY_DN68845_c0_g1_i1.p2 TRINITY_DN68845_c0_g1~~TRINITY_DN68845_c0_g1_i1.p2  ORF type:complete len:157 (+),score=30.59 TRINITY_DN68845_c0_g1_i1:33-503(+)